MSNNQAIKLENMSQFFDSKAKGYDNHMEETIKSFDDFYSSISKPITKTDLEISILDLGCGTGLEIQGILDRCPNALITGMDVSQNMLMELIIKHAEHLEQIKLVNASYLTAELGENKYHHVISVMTMHHLLHDIKKGLYKKIRRALKPGGLYIEGDYIVSPEKEGHLLDRYHRKVADFKTSENGDFHIDIPFSMKTQKKLLLDAGFSDIEVIWQEGEAAILVAKG